MPIANFAQPRDVNRVSIFQAKKLNKSRSFDNAHRQFYSAPRPG